MFFCDSVKKLAYLMSFLESLSIDFCGFVYGT